MRTKQQLKDYDTKAKARVRLDIKNEFSKTQSITWLSFQEVKKLLCSYSQSEIQAGSRDVNGQWVCKELIYY